MQRLFSHGASALAALVITVSTLTAAAGVPGQQLAALVSAPGFA